MRLPPPEVEPVAACVHRRASKASTGSNSKDATNPNSGPIYEGMYTSLPLQGVQTQTGQK